MSQDNLTAAAKVEQLSFFQRRKLGLTTPNIIRVAKDLKQAGVPVTAENIAEKIADENPPSLIEGEKVGANFAAWIAFIQKILPVILELLQMFGV